MTAERKARSTEAFFGRRHGKTLRPLQTRALGRLHQFRVDLDSAAPDSLRGLFSAPVGEVRLEIGFGGGEHLLAEARRLPGVGFIGVEPFVNGMARLLTDLGEATPENLRLHDDDATVLLDWLPPASLAQIDLLYPDPWPKKRHWKRRFVNAANLDRFARALAPGGVFRFASDVPDYIEWTLERLSARADFAPVEGDASVPYPFWPSTRYEAKAMREGRTPVYLEFQRA